MDKDIRVLEKIGLHEVCKKTHIEVKQLEYMINADYGKLNKINTLGFVKILSLRNSSSHTAWKVVWLMYPTSTRRMIPRWMRTFIALLIS